MRADEFIAAVFEVAVLDGPLGWLTAMFNAAAYEVSGLHRDAADEVWSAGPHALIATSYGRRRGSSRDGRLTGRWESVVGAEHADWLLLSAGNDVVHRVLVPLAARYPSARSPPRPAQRRGYLRRDGLRGGD